MTDAGTKETACLARTETKLNHFFFKKIISLDLGFLYNVKASPPPSRNRPPLTAAAPTVCAHKFLSTRPPRKTNDPSITSSPGTWAGLRASRLAVPTQGRETEAAEMAWWVRMLAARPAGMSSIPGAHVVKGELAAQVVRGLPPMLWHIHAHSSACTRAHTL